MENNKYQIIPQKDLLKELVLFKDWSGPILVKVMSDTSEFGMRSLGSGGLLNYKGRYFVITNEHVISSVQNDNRINEIFIPYKNKMNVDNKMKIIDEKSDFGEDLAVLEICPKTIKDMNNHHFLDEIYLESDIEDFVNRTNVVFLHGFPGSETKINDNDKLVDMTTFPYLTFVESYDTFVGTLDLHTEDTGLSELGTTVNIPDFYGMSGSFVYGYNKGNIIPYTFLGILTNWYKSENKLAVTPTKDVIKFLEDNFINKTI